MQIDPRFPPRLSLSDTFWLQVANIFRFPKIFISLIRPSIWMMLILIVFSPITAPCAECLAGTIISRTIESHLPCFDKSTSCDTRQMAPLCTCHLLWLTSLDPAHMVTGVRQWACASMTLNISYFTNIFHYFYFIHALSVSLFRREKESLFAWFVIQERPGGSLFHWALLTQRMQGYEDNTKILTSLANYPESQLQCLEQYGLDVKQRSPQKFSPIWVLGWWECVNVYLRKGCVVLAALNTPILLWTWATLFCQPQVTRCHANKEWHFKP